MFVSHLSSTTDREGVRFHVVRLSFHHIRLGGILAGVQTKQGKQMLKSTLIAKCLTKCQLLPDLNSGENAVREIFEEYL